MSILLTLQIPLRGRVIPVATATSPTIIRNFCMEVIEDYRIRERSAEDEIEAVVYRAELERLRKVFTLIAPDFAVNEEGGSD